MRIAIDRELCEANGVCAGVAPEVFVLDDDDVLHLQVLEPGDEEQRRRIEAAIAACPRAALSWDTPT